LLAAPSCFLRRRSPTKPNAEGKNTANAVKIMAAKVQRGPASSIMIPEKTVQYYENYEG
jgi:hypothetical protein